MTEQEFAPQISRLSETFGKTAYGNERVRLIWREVETFRMPWFRDLVDAMIGTFRQAPLVPDFREAGLRERERIWQENKREESKQVKEWVSQFSKEDDKLMAQTILRRLNRTISDSDWASFLQMLDRMPKEAT